MQNGNGKQVFPNKYDFVDKLNNKQNVEGYYQNVSFYEPNDMSKTRNWLDSFKNN